ncbi:MAG: class I SAM-dependent methyltransferase [Haloarculaceae archaeon]
MATGDARVFDRFSPLYDRFKPPTDRAKLAPALTLAEREVERVLDLAGGTGQGVRALDVRERLVADAAPGMVRRARDRGLDAVQADAAALPFDDASVDAVLVLDALHHLPDQAGALAEAARVLRPGGVLVVLEYDPTTLPGKAIVAGERLIGFDSTFLAPGNLEAMVRAAGLGPAVVDVGFEYALAGVKPS